MKEQKKQMKRFLSSTLNGLVVLALIMPSSVGTNVMAEEIQNGTSHTVRNLENIARDELYFKYQNPNEVVRVIVELEKPAAIEEAKAEGEKKPSEAKIQEVKEEQKDAKDEAEEITGEKIIGTERHESRRIDNQLRGRAGRQGDPGESKFYLSLEDDLMRLFGSERMMGVYKALKIPEGEEIQHKTITKQIEKAQKKIENNNFGIRRNLLDYDQVNNDQREVIYAERRRVLNGESMRDVVYKMIKDVVADDVNMVAGEQPLKELNLVELNESLRRKIPLEPITLTDEEKEKNDKEALISRLQDEAMKVYHKKEKDFNEFAKVNVPEEGVELGEEDAAIFNDGIREVERVILLKVIDSKWMNHIDDMDQLRESIGLQSYAQKDPVVQYKFLGYDMFEEMTKNIRHDTVGALMHVQIEQKVERKQVARATGTNKDELVERGPYRRKEAKIGRNAPCPCGSGKKYKNCCGRFAN